jgi:hypothetical protein
MVSLADAQRIQIASVSVDRILTQDEVNQRSADPHPAAPRRGDRPQAGCERDP